MKPHMSLQVAGGGEPLVTHLAFVRFFSSVDQVVFLEVGELGEAFAASLADKRSLTSVCPQVDLQVGQLAEGFETNVALVVHLTVFLL